MFCYTTLRPSGSPFRLVESLRVDYGPVGGTCVNRHTMLCGGKMFKQISVVLLLTVGGSSLRADLSYDQTTKMTGGAMMGMMRFAGAFSKQAREPMVTHVYLKGDRMAHFTRDTAQITDLSNETITSVNFQKRTYSVMTFAEMAQAMAEVGQKMTGEPGEKPDVSMKVDVKATGQTRQISGFETREMVLTVEMETTDPKSGAKGSMLTTSTMWIAKDVTGYQQMKAFHERMAKKMVWAPGANLGPMAAGNPGMMKGMAAAAKEASKLEGAPLLQIVRMGMKGMPAPAEGGSQQSSQQTEPRSEPRNTAETKRQEEAPSVGSVLGGRLGRLGGLGRRKKPAQEEQPKTTEQPPQEQQPAPQQQAGAPQDQGVLMESTIEMSEFSTASVDGSKLQVPAGFQQVENEMLKGMRRK